MDVSGDALVEALFEQRHVGVAVCDSNGRLLRFNSALESMVGPAVHSSQDTWASAYRLSDASGASPLTPGEVPLARALAGEIVVDAPITMRRPGEPVRHLHCTTTPLRQGSRITAALVLVTQVTEATEDDDSAAGHKIRAARHRQRMNQMRDVSVRLAAIANHQIRTPLTVIRGHVELLEADADHLPAPARRALPAIKSGVDSLTEALTALSHASDLAHATDPTLEPIDLIDVAERAITQACAVHPDIRVQLFTGPTDYVPASADPLWVRRAIAALIDAVRDSTSDTGVAVHVTEDGDTVRVSLSPAGTPQAPSVNAKLTNFRGDSTANPHGLGMLLAQTVALAHDGGLDIAESHAGTTVTLLLSREPDVPP
ncbi:sensor histidine kinase [Nocardioides gansuensis]|nr:HAMP domain-containing sensor histidine kinase [Nocardioides gansuensis]